MSVHHVPPIPHRPPALFVERIVDVGAGSMRAVARVPEGAPLSAGATFAAEHAVEIAAQAAACRMAIDERSPEEAIEHGALGHLVSIDELDVHVAVLPAGRELEVEIVAGRAIGPLSQWRFTLSSDGRVAAAGRFSVHVTRSRRRPPESPAR